MSPNGAGRGGRARVINNLYTVILALSLAVVVATAVFVAYRCYFRYDTIFSIP